MIRVALTGGIATGKSYVRARVAGWGVPTIDADAVVHQLLREPSDVVDAVVAQFGRGVLRPDGGVDRAALGRLVFADARARAGLEAILHPVAWRRIARWAADLDQAGTRWALADIPLLFETGRAGEFDRVVVVACDAATQVLRVVARDGISEADAKARLAAQWPIDEKVRRADHVIRTDGSLVETDRQVDDLCALFDSLTVGSGPEGPKPKA